MQKDWLKKKITVAEAETENMISTAQLSSSPVPFGFQNAKWKAFLAKMQDSDELWTFSSSGESWTKLCGRAGISIVRNGEIVDSIVTMMN